MILQLAGYLAASWRPEHRWRRVALPLAIVFTAVCLFSSVSLWNMAELQQDRIDARTGVASTGDASSDLYVRPGLSKLDSRQYQINWIAPAGVGHTILPPGLSRLPAPGEAFVSPALAERWRDSATLQTQLPRIEVLTNDGLADRKELIAWVRPLDDGALVRNPGVRRIASFGVALGGAGFRFDLTNNLQELPVAVVLLGLFVVPGVIILALGVLTTSALRDRRVELLRLLGAGESWTFRLTLAELLMIAIPSLALVSAFWLVLTHSLIRLPVQGKQVIPGDLELHWGQYALVWFAMLVAMALIVVVQQFWAERPARTATHVRRAPVVTWIVRCVRFVPVVAGVALAVYGGIRGGDTGGTYWMYGVSTVFASIPLVLPLIGKPIGEFLTGFEHLSALLAGRRIERDPNGTLRPFLALGVLAVIAPIAFGVLSFLNDQEHWRPIGQTPSAVQVRWSGGERSSTDVVSLIQTKLPETFVVAAYERADGPGIVLIADCGRTAAYLGLGAGDVCRDQTEPVDLDRMQQTSLSRMLRSGPVTFSSQDEPAKGDLAQLIVFSHRTAAETREALSGMLDFGGYPSLMITSADDSGFAKTASSVWLESGMIVLILVLGLAALLSVVDRTIGTHTHRRLLLSLGASSSQIRRMDALAFLVPFVAMSLLGLIVGAINVQAFRSIQGGPFPMQQMVALIVALGIAGMVGAAGIAYLGDPTRDTHSANET